MSSVLNPSGCVEETVFIVILHVCLTKSCLTARPITPYVCMDPDRLDSKRSYLPVLSGTSLVDSLFSKPTEEEAGGGGTSIPIAKPSFTAS